MSNAVRCIDQILRSRILVYHVWPCYSTRAIKRQSCTQKKKKRFQVARNDEASTFFVQSNMNVWLHNNGSVGKASRSELDRVAVSLATVSQAIWVQFSLGAETLCSPCIDKRAFILLLSLYHFFLSWISSLLITLKNNLIIQVRCPLIFFLSIEVIAVLEFDKCPARFCTLFFESGKSFLSLPQGNSSC